MTDGAVTTTTVTEALARWRVDARITELFVGPTNSALAVWIAELDLGTGAKDLRCLYAWVIATAGGEPGVTEASEKWQTLGKSASRFRLRRVVYRDTAPASYRKCSAAARWARVSAA
jgi:hypothetical protein